MRSSNALIHIQLTLLSVLYFQCLTIDPPPPRHLSAPNFIYHNVIAATDYTNIYHEKISLRWEPDSTDSISPQIYQLLYRTDIDSFFKPIKNIPADTEYYFQQTSIFDTLARTTEHVIFYRIFAFDSLGRGGDTSDVCTVSLARTITLIYPTTSTNDFTEKNCFLWEVPEGIVSRNFSHALLWKEDSLIWESDSAVFYSMGSAKQVEKKIPNIFLPLQKGTYYWGVKLAIIDKNDPLSITIGKFNIE